MTADPADTGTHVPAAWLDALVAIATGNDPGAATPELQAAGLLYTTPDDAHDLTERGRTALSAECRRRHAHAAALPFGGVTVTTGPFAGQAGYYDDDVHEETHLGPELLEGWSPAARAVVYLFARGEPLASEPIEVPHHHLEPAVHMDLERWVQANPTRAALLGIPSLSGIEQHVSPERLREAQDRSAEILADVIDVPEWSGGSSDDVPF